MGPKSPCGKGHVRAFPTTLCRAVCKNGWTDRFAVCVMDSDMPKEAQVHSYSQVAPICCNSSIFNSHTARKTLIICCKTVTMFTYEMIWRSLWRDFVFSIAHRISFNYFHCTMNRLRGDTFIYSRPMEWGRPLSFCPVFFFYLLFSPRLISAIADWMSAILPQMMWL